MSKEKINTKPLSNYEYNAMWMSYRYAIGRHTIASVTHAGNLVKNVYHRLPIDKKEWTAFDMRREIDRCLDISFNFHLDYSVPAEYYNPFKALIEVPSRIPDDEKEIGLFNYLRQHRVVAKLDENKQWQFDSYLLSQNIDTSEIEDLLVWANAANALDPNVHYIATVEYDGKTEEHEVFEYISLEQNIDADKDFRIEYSDINEYLDKPYYHTWISKNYITKLEPVNKNNE